MTDSKVRPLFDDEVEVVIDEEALEASFQAHPANWDSQPTG